MSAARKEGSRWILSDCEDSAVSLDLDFAVTLRRGDGLLVRIEQPLVVRLGAGVECEIDPSGNSAALAPLLGLIRDGLTGGVAESSGALELFFASGKSITVAPSHRYEAWELSAPDGLRLVSLPGGGLAEWSANPDGGAYNP